MDIFDDLRANELEELIPIWDAAYTKGEPLVTDAVYDAARDELKELRADSAILKKIGSPVVTSWAKVTHGFSMGSLEKVNLPEELLEWVIGTGFPRDMNDMPFLFWTEKLDGISIHLRYENGKFVQGATRGDDTVGEDITPNVRRMKGVVQEISGFTGSLRGEVVLTKSDFAKHFPDKANTRNTAAGVSKRYDGKGSEHLTVMAYTVLDSDMIEASAHNIGVTEFSQFMWLRSKGFLVPNFGEVSRVVDVNAVWEKYQESTRESLDYDIDGLVVRINRLDLQIGLGDKDGKPHGARAFKFAGISRETTVLDIVWQVGASGRMTPVAVITPTFVLGTTITNVSLYNIGYIRTLGIHIGARVLVTRANDVIPRITEVVEKSQPPAEPPSHCPVCGSETEMEGEYLICPNTSDCAAQTVGRIERHIKSLDIKEWGEVLVEKLVSSGKVKAVPDLYRLTVKDLAELDRISEGVAEKLLKTLREKNPIGLENLLGSLSIPGCASSTIRMVMDAGHDSWSRLAAVDIAMLTKVPGLGPVKSRSLQEWLSKHSGMVNELLGLGVQIKEIIVGNLTGKSFCFTGTMVRKRADLAKMVTGAGGRLEDRVGRGLTYLVISDPNSTTSKAVAARKNGTQCISEEQFIGMVDG